ncbi:MAG: AMIN domain-containing protein [Archangiaceae bacterium]|nr:AMIN domain-containing protein [Archangiaceae bacterium]
MPLIDGPPRAFRVLSGNLSKQGMFLSTPEPFAEGTKVALSIEAGGRVLPFAQGEVMWRQMKDGLGQPGKVCGGAGFGVRFTGFLHPRAHDLVEFLVRNLDTGRPLALPRPPRWKKVALWSVGVAATVALCALGMMLGRQVTFERAGQAEAEADAEVAAAPAQAEVAVAPEPAAPQVNAPLVIDAEPPPAQAAVPPPPAKAEVKPQPVLVAASPQAAKKDDSNALGSTGLLPLPKCAASSLRWAVKGARTELEVAPVSGGRFAAAFRMKSPERLVIDLNGPMPKRSFVVKASEIPNVTGLRIGKRKGGTRLVLDLAKPANLKVDGSRLELTY